MCPLCTPAGAIRVNHWKLNVLSQQCSQRLRRHGVDVVYDYGGTFLKFLKVSPDFKGTISQKKVFRCVYTSKSNNLKIWISPYLKKKFGVRIVIDNVDTCFSRISSQSNISEKKKNFLNRFCLFIWVQVESFKQKKWSKISWHCPCLRLCLDLVRAFFVNLCYIIA